MNKVVPRDQLMAAAEEYAQAIVTRAPLAVIFAKEAVREGYEMSLDDGLRLETDLSALLRTTSDVKEGARAFVEKRAPAVARRVTIGLGLTDEEMTWRNTAPT